MTGIFQELTTKIAVFWNYHFYSGGAMTLTVGKLISAILVFIAGWKIITFLIKLLSKKVLQSRIKEYETIRWVESFLGLILFIQLAILTLVAAGVPFSVFNKFRHIVLFSIKEHPVELGNVIIGLFVLYAGLKLSGYISGQFFVLVLNRLQLDDASKNNIKKIFHYILLVLVVLFVLSMVGIPLTAFTVIGGAFAIGVGLGSQNLINNFLSGLVMMVERPLKIGDIVEVEGRRGRVEEIGARSTRIRTSDNLRLVIPNSILLENTVINYSLMDDIIRREVTIGVAYGSPVEKVSDLMHKAVMEHKAIEKKPEPLILFYDFGDNALIFRAMFWMKIKEYLHVYMVESDLRFAINKSFNKAGIVVAFPQRDIHLDALKPIEIKMFNNNTGNSQNSPEPS